MRITALVIFSFLLASCSEMSYPKFSSFTPYKMEIQQGNMITPEMRDKIQTGMSSATVRSILGTPLVADPFHPNRWDYVYTLQKDGKQEGSQRLTLYFKEDRLEKIDDSGIPALAAPSGEKKQEGQ